MRATLDPDEDILRTGKALARERGESLGRVISDLAKRGLRSERSQAKVRNGIPLLRRLPGARPVTSEAVKELLESED